MIPTSNRQIKTRAVPALEADRAEYRVILEDMVRHSGPLIPDPNWLGTEDASKPAESYDRKQALDFALSDEHYFNKIAEMKGLMLAWVGNPEPPSAGAIEHYGRFLKESDALGLWEANVPEQAVPLAHQDLGTLMDLNLIYAFSSSSRKEKTRVLEVGGGYGRLAEGMFNIFGKSVQYVIVDAVPASLYYAKKYLTAACPEARVGSYYDGVAEFDLGNYDIAIVPAWHFEQVNGLRFDVCLNIESMQEMNQAHVDYYLNLFDSAAADDATIYLSNARDYYFRGEFRHPRHWQKLFCANTPRSWTVDHPTEIFRKSTGDYSLANRACDALHKVRLWQDGDADEFIARNGAKRLIGPVLKETAKALSTKIRG